MTRNLVIVLTAVICTLPAARVRADTRVTVHDFYGPSAGRLRDDVVNLLERQSGVTIVSKGQVDSLAMKLGVDPFSTTGRMILARELQLSAWMTGVVKKQPDGLMLTVVVHDGAQHSLISRTSLRASNTSELAGEIRERLWRKSRRPLLQASAPGTAGASEIVPIAAKADSEATIAAKAADSEAESAAKASDSEAAVETTAPESLPEVAQTMDEEVPPRVSNASSSGRDDGEDIEEETRNKGSDKRGETLRAFLGFGSPYRSLAYRDPITSSLGDYQLNGAPMVDVNLAFHPARPFVDNWMSWIGLDVRAQIAASTPSFDRYGSRFKSSYDAYQVGLRGRIPLGDHYVSVFSGYAVSRFEVTAESKDVRSQTPNVDYRTVRTGLGGEFAISDSLMLGLDGAWLTTLSVGEIAEWFPHSTAGGLEVATFATYKLTRTFFARAAATYQRTFFDFNSKPGDDKVAGGATDQYFAMSVGAGVHL